MRYFITLDVGTTAVKAGLFSQGMEQLALRIHEYTLESPKPEVVELDPEIYWTSAVKGIREVLAATGVKGDEVACVTCATQGETLIPVDEAGRALGKAMVWLDARAQAEGRWIQERMDALRLYQTTGLPEVNGFTPLAKLLWVKNRCPEIYAKTHRFLLLEDYLVHRLCGRFVTNPAVMCTTGYLDIHKEAVWTEALESCGLDPGKIPQVLPCGVQAGRLLPGAAKELGLPEGVWVSTGAMDQVASAVGLGNLSPGVVTETTGTCQAVAATVVAHEIPEWSPVTYYSHAVPGKWLKIVINQTAGIAYKWFRDEFCADLAQAAAKGDGPDAFERMSELAQREPAGSNGLTFFPHMTGMQFPMTDESARGVFFGVGLNTGRGAFARAIMEGVGYMLRESMERMGLAPDKVISLGGGAKSPLWCQIKASICGRPFQAPDVPESTSLGAAMLGALAVGALQSLEEAPRPRQTKGLYPPVEMDRETYEQGYREYLGMYECFAPLFQQRTRRDG